MDVRCQRAIDAHAHVARAALADRLGREHMFDLRGSDPERARPERAVRRGVAVAADDRHSRLRTTLLASDNMDDPPARLAHPENIDPDTALIFDQGFLRHARLAIGTPRGAPR